MNRRMRRAPCSVRDCQCQLAIAARFAPQPRDERLHSSLPGCGRPDAVKERPHGGDGFAAEWGTEHSVPKLSGKVWAATHGNTAAVERCRDHLIPVREPKHANGLHGRNPGSLKPCVPLGPRAAVADRVVVQPHVMRQIGWRP
jgi:hypothetical protein